ncbi:hypothetical protein LTR37_001578 [Vermiconidia calcicola]|uniref:Uncharacterized protein n=1 Tax=Vermiconidia calcicola TaxID=1690605 RepID=A0ACC3NV35_9PEZI|nr:hypothetical protein LTR37_001578 [Vermiconidia calcicola]
MAFLLPAATLFLAGVASAQSLPDQAQVIDQLSFNVLESVPPPAEMNSTNVPGLTAQSAYDKPFHVYHEDFLDIIGSNPTLTLVARTDSDPLFHEAVVWYPPTDEIFFVQNAGAMAAGTGLNKSAIIQKIALAEADAVRTLRNASGLVTVTTVPSNPMVINPNGATNYRGEIMYMGEGQGEDIAPSIYVMNPLPPYNTTVVLNNYFGRQFNSLNDVVIHPVTKDVYFTDTWYGYLQDFRPPLGLPNQVYRMTPSTGAVTVVSDQLVSPNGLTFSPNGSYAYVTDTGSALGFYGTNQSAPSTIYRFAVSPTTGKFSDQTVFAFPSPGFPDGVHCDTNGNVYSGCGDGVQVWNPAGVLIGKIFTGTTAANFAFGGQGRMVICGETELFYATLAATGAVVRGQMS